MNQQKPVSISIDQTVPVICENCGNDTFQEALFLRKVSRFITLTPEDGMQPIPTIICTKCSTPVADFVPAALKRKTDDAEG